MSIGRHTYWLIVYLPDGEAITPPEDRRLALRFVTAEDAERYMQTRKLDKDFYLVVKVPA